MPDNFPKAPEWTDHGAVKNETRPVPRALSPEEQASLSAVKASGQALIDCIKANGSSREASLAITKAEEAVMWAVKGLTR